MEDPKPIVRIHPQNIELKENESVQFQMFMQMEDGTEKPVKQEEIRWQENGGGGYLDEYGVLSAINPGAYSINAAWGEHIITEYYTIKAIEGKKKTINEKFEEKLDKTEKTEPPIQRSTLKKITVDELRSRVPKKKVGIMAHTRATIRTIDANPDLVWSGIVIILCVMLGGCFILLLNGFSIERISAFISIALGAIFSFFKKIYSSPGEISREIEEKMLGTNDKERLESLEKKKKEIESRIKRLTTKVRNVDQIQKQSFYKLTMDETATY